MKFKFVCLSFIPLFLFIGCGAAHHIAVQVDASFATSVFAASDAAMEACKQGVFTPAQCTVGGDVNRNAQQALVDVKAITKVLQDSPKTFVVPKNLPDLLSSLSALQTFAGDLAPTVPAKKNLTLQVDAALRQAIKVVQTFTAK